ncbi:unnamed protein product [Polarella glacialis]|uniref:Uncharacterized protein n=1 Tax=Polarella glacialis TaxID=89957 RepID=A0A813L2D9_POLGL|nr:unnamed protein product [Polarella glacialis]CAE8673267.1 unnamed protein product [Polarella glacialis]CAE8717970.1 unnamed protein product [Polarella glacialis]|mmetsp:Transcript_47546/g.77083  ORF Transcript_47546/g.77083 Transcript_47546/m.77083 type:complete len:109 (+) Transcript_47546:219-545(+)
MNQPTKETPQYQTLKRIQKTFLVRCNESLTKIIPGTGVRPASQIRRLEKDLKLKRDELGKLSQQDLLGQMSPNRKGKAAEAQEYATRRAQLLEAIQQMERQLSELELR